MDDYFIKTRKKRKPMRQTLYSCGADLYADKDYVLRKGEVVAVGTGCKINQKSEFFKLYKEECFVGLFIRSSLAKRGVILANGVGVVDMDYPDEIKVLLLNIAGEGDIEIKAGERVAQMVILPHYTGMESAGFDTSGKIRCGGFGSTGRK